MQSENDQRSDLSADDQSADKSWLENPNFEVIAQNIRSMDINFRYGIGDALEAVFKMCQSKDNHFKEFLERYHLMSERSARRYRKFFRDTTAAAIKEGINITEYLQLHPEINSWSKPQKPENSEDPSDSYSGKDDVITIEVAAVMVENMTGFPFKKRNSKKEWENFMNRVVEGVPFKRQDKKKAA